MNNSNRAPLLRRITPTASNTELFLKLFSFQIAALILLSGYMIHRNAKPTPPTVIFLTDRTNDDPLLRSLNREIQTSEFSSHFRTSLIQTSIPTEKEKARELLKSDNALRLFTTATIESAIQELDQPQLPGNYARYPKWSTQLRNILQQTNLSIIQDSLSEAIAKGNIISIVCFDPGAYLSIRYSVLKKGVVLLNVCDTTNAATPDKTRLEYRLIPTARLQTVKMGESVRQTAASLTAMYKKPTRVVILSDESDMPNSPGDLLQNYINSEAPFITTQKEQVPVEFNSKGQYSAKPLKPNWLPENMNQNFLFVSTLTPGRIADILNEIEKWRDLKNVRQRSRYLFSDDQIVNFMEPGTSFNKDSKICVPIVPTLKMNTRVKLGDGRSAIASRAIATVMLLSKAPKDIYYPKDLAAFLQESRLESGSKAFDSDHQSNMMEYEVRSYGF